MSHSLTQQQNLQHLSSSHTCRPYKPLCTDKHLADILRGLQHYINLKYNKQHHRAADQKDIPASFQMHFDFLTTHVFDLVLCRYDSLETSTYNKTQQKWRSQQKEEEEKLDEKRASRKKLFITLQIVYIKNALKINAFKSK